jgi:hypothetical protein
MAKRSQKPAFDPRRYPDHLPYMCKLKLIEELGSIQQARGFAHIHKNELAKERPIKEKLQKSDARVRRKLAELERQGIDNFVSSQHQNALPPPTSSLVAGMLHNTLPKCDEAPVAEKQKASTRIIFLKRLSGKARVFTSRAGAGAKLDSKEIKSLRTRAWFDSLLKSINPGLSIAYADSYAFKKSRSKFLRMSWLCGRNRLQSDLIEHHYDASTISQGNRLVALDLYKRDYENGTSRPSAQTLLDFELVFPRTKAIYEIGFFNMPVWEIFDGNKSVCCDFLEKHISGIVQGTPDQWAQHILDLALSDASHQPIQSFVEANNFYSFNAWLGVALSRSIDPLDLKFAYLSMALIAVFQIFDSTKLLPTKSLKWVISAFHRMGLYQYYFGPVVADFIKTQYLKDLPVFKI